jgi:hypothetical protein
MQRLDEREGRLDIGSAEIRCVQGTSHTRNLNEISGLFLEVDQGWPWQPLPLLPPP